MALTRRLQRQLRGVAPENLHPKKGRKRAGGWPEFARLYGKLLDVEDVSLRGLGADALEDLLSRYAQLRRMGESVRVPRAATSEQREPSGPGWNAALLLNLRRLHAVLKQTIPPLLAEDPPKPQRLATAFRLVRLSAPKRPLTEADVFAWLHHRDIGTHADPRANVLMLLARSKDFPFRRCGGRLADGRSCERIVGGLARDRFCSRECFWSAYVRSRGFARSRREAVKEHRLREKAGEPRLRKPGAGRPRKQPTEE